ncbi:putative aquaporin SIP1-2 isoform D [Glycine soja]|uniref:Putative aquaporin SIP1-2 isoform D n=1 Tax=Glycine soja TaxID=3848 RepID=A0A445GIX4_GLYSO|nr:putative aquaporin SIP1-2 isoform D [Glycine soja]
MVAVTSHSFITFLDVAENCKQTLLESWLQFAYAQNPQQTAESLISLLDKAESVVPREFRPKTPVGVGVRDLLKQRSTLKSELDAVTVLDGTQEGAFQWVTIPYLLGKLGKDFSETVGVVDLGGGSVLAFCFQLLGLRFTSSSCEDFKGSYIYGGKSYKASSTPSGASLNECKSIALKALKVNGSNVHIRSALLGGYGMVVGVMNRKTFLLPHFSLTGQLSLQACKTKLEDAKSTYQRVEEGNLPYLCMDLVYQYTLLVGFGLDPWQQIITLVKKVRYHDAFVEAAWSLGSTIEAVSST